MCHHAPTYTYLPHIKLDFCYRGTKHNGHWVDSKWSLPWGFYDMILRGGFLGFIRCWSSHWVPAQLPGFFRLLCVLWISWAEFVSTSWSFWVDNPNRQMLMMGLLYVGFLSSSFLMLPNLGNSLKKNERTINLIVNPTCPAYAGTGNEDTALN